jgi:hypothetical protein
MRDDLKNFEITTEQMIEYSGKDFFNNSLSEEQLNKIWQEEYKNFLQDELAANGYKELAELVLPSSFFSGPFKLNLHSITEDIDGYLNDLNAKLLGRDFGENTKLGAWILNKEHERLSEMSRMSVDTYIFIVFVLSLLTLFFPSFYEFFFEAGIKIDSIAHSLLMLLLISTVVSAITAVSVWERRNSEKKEYKAKLLIEQVTNAKISSKEKTDNYIAQYKEKYAKDHTPSKVLSALIAEIRKYNAVTEELAYNIHVIDQLQEAGEAVKIKDRDNVLGAFRTMRNDLIRALKVERILRENPRFKPELFSINFAPLEDLKLSQQVANCEQLVNDALILV